MRVSSSVLVPGNRIGSGPASTRRACRCQGRSACRRGRTGSNNIPKAASLVQGATGLVVIVFFAATGEDPMARLYFWLVISSPRRVVVSV